jgi:hypothetical protein
MIHTIKKAGLLAMIAIIGFACQNKGGGEVESLPPGNHKAEIVDVELSSNYTYLQVDEMGSEYWIAVNKQMFEKGETIYFLTGLKMENFESKDLGQTFDVIYFVQDIDREPIEQVQEMVRGQTEAKKPKLVKEELEVEIPDGGVSIQELYTDPTSFDGKTIVVRGKVTKVNPNIMDRNWIHIQDGTGTDDQFDLTITTLHTPQPGEIVTFRGKIALNRDFGAGYVYDVLLENAEVVK